MEKREMTQKNLISKQFNEPTFNAATGVLDRRNSS